MKKRIIAASLVSASLLSACSLGGSSESVLGDFNFSPEILNPDPTGFEVSENQVSAFTVSATDPDLDPLSLSISGTDGDLFIHQGGGVIEFRDAPDFEMPSDANTDNRYEMTITVTDGVNNDVVDFAVTVLDDTSDNTVKPSCGDTQEKGQTQSGLKSCKMSIAGTERSFALYLPEKTNSQSSLLVSLHGQNERAEDNITYTGLTDMADQTGLILAFPQASISTVSGQSEWEKEADIAFVSAITNYVSDNYTFNSDRVYATGKSAGGAMVFDLACSADNPFAAIGIVGGSMTPSTQASCQSNRVMPLIQVHGKLDNIIPIAGNTTYLHLDAVTGFWAKTNNCSAVTEVTIINDSDADADILGGLNAKLGGCDLNSSIEVFALDGLGSEWPNQQNFDIDASKVIWDFISSYDRNGPIE